jgi:hypothetical protein
MGLEYGILIFSLVELTGLLSIALWRGDDMRGWNIGHTTIR